jgi:hypothetical protein
VAQLGARFHGMEEVKGSNPFRSTKLLKDLAPLVAFGTVTEVYLESKFDNTYNSVTGNESVGDRF